MYIKEDVPAQCYRAAAATKPQPQENTATVFYTTTLLWSPLITAMCFEKVLKTTSNITAPF